MSAAAAAAAASRPFPPVGSSTLPGQPHSKAQGMHNTQSMPLGHFMPVPNGAMGGGAMVNSEALPLAPLFILTPEQLAAAQAGHGPGAALFALAHQNGSRGGGGVIGPDAIVSMAPRTSVHR